VAPSAPALSQPATPPSPACTMSAQVRAASSGPDSWCAEEVLSSLGYPLAGRPDDVFDDASVRALRRYQEANGLLADGVLGPVTGTHMGVWDEAAAQARAFEVPADSGDGRRVVYSRSSQRSWAIDADGTTVKTYLVSGRANEPQPVGWLRASVHRRRGLDVELGRHRHDGRGPRMTDRRPVITSATSAMGQLADATTTTAAT